MRISLGTYTDVERSDIYFAGKTMTLSMAHTGHAHCCVLIQAILRSAHVEWGLIEAALGLEAQSSLHWD